MNPTITFEAAEFSARLERLAERYCKLVKDLDGDHAGEWIASFEREWQANRERAEVALAFVGQYNAGKSTMVSALTGRDDIRISADITTDTATQYQWNGIKVLDTPGLFTERKDHDAITYDALRRSDLLVFSLTQLLFDSITAANFKKLAFEEGFQKKIMLVVNKVNAEAGEVEERIARYETSLAEALSPYSLEGISRSYIDARDYLEGVRDDDEFLVRESRFESFIEELNVFIRERGTLGKLDTPVRVLLEHIGQAQARGTRKSGQDDGYVLLLNQMTRRCREQRKRMRNRVSELVNELWDQVTGIGREIAREIGGQNDIESLVRESETKIESLVIEAQQNIDEEVEEVWNEMKDEFQRVLSGDLATNLKQSFEVESKPQIDSSSYRRVGCPEDVNRIRDKWKSLIDIGNRIGVDIANQAIGRAGTITGTLLKPAQVAGSSLHGTVLSVGKFFGVKFKPWQAVGIAGKIGTVAKFLGPVLSVASTGLEVCTALKEEAEAKRFSEARVKCAADYRSMAEDLTKQYLEALWQLETETFDQVDMQIEQARKAHTTEVGRNDNRQSELQCLRGEVNTLLAELNSISATQCV